MKLKIMAAHKDANRYELLRQKYLKLGYTSMIEALDNNPDFYFWVQRLKKFNKNYK